MKPSVIFGAIFTLASITALAAPTPQPMATPQPPLVVLKTPNVADARLTNSPNCDPKGAACASLIVHAIVPVGGPCHQFSAKLTPIGVTGTQRSRLTIYDQVRQCGAPEMLNYPINVPVTGTLLSQVFLANPLYIVQLPPPPPK